MRLSPHPCLPQHSPEEGHRGCDLQELESDPVLEKQFKERSQSKDALAGRGKKKLLNSEPAQNRY